MKNHFKQISDKISKLPIDQLAIESGFQKRKSKKIDAVGFVAGFFMMLQLQGNSLRDWAIAIGYFTGNLVSKQGLNKKLQFRHEAFAYQLLNAAIRQSLKTKKYLDGTELFAFFKKVYLEDSSCFKLPSNLASFFPGPHSSRGSCATAKIQLRMDLLNERYEGLCLQSYRDNDQKHSKDILSVLQVGDLVIRDLGYWSLEVFKQISNRQAFFLSRYRYDVACLDAQSQEIIDLPAFLKQRQRNGEMIVDLPILIGKKAQLPVRFIAIKAPDQIAQARRRKAAKNRHQRANHSKEYFELLGWTLFVTNVPVQYWSCTDVLKAYRFRWRIEMIFKCWKSKWKLAQLFENKSSLSPARLVITCLLFLVFMILFFVPWMRFFTHFIFEQHHKYLSIFKFADFVKEHFWDLLSSKDLTAFVPFLAYYCTYEKRNDRLNHLELLYDKILS